ncbi:sushi, von Willebrand factor type A, EGF and pentraxin domain-containing protein 1-like [Bactrocera dorsalis]|uniref:Sushi, von Willebrand factor type A, EGF and pentraxin domain-containing protein 1-like n=1 Tax=Bactrocera dorsalis TaxID=27457 RepID=A0ABM3J4Z1_BACDO|nr:sushi, von Willebrand factor type A, EGF and pentraxin domain-containing protein 1-like [Bactrocera dorsalis]
MIVQKTSVHSPAATTSAENFDWFKYFKKPFEHTQVKIPQINKNQTFPIDIRNSTPSKQLKSNENKGQEAREYPIRLAFLDPILYTLNVTTQTPNLKVNLSSSPNNSIVSNLSIQSLINSPPLTSAVTHIPETLNATEKFPNNPGSITKTLSNRYSDTTTNKATTEVRTQCILRSCDFPLICKILLSSSQDSGRLHVEQARQSLFEGSEVVFNCADGYVLEGVNRTTCKTNGLSHKIPSCIPCCDADFKLSCTPPLKCVYEEPNISTKHVITNYFADTVVREHFKLSFECADGYLLEGSKIRKCTAKGWSNVMPRCVNYCDVLDLGIPKFPLKCQMLDSLTGLTNGCQYSLWQRKVKEGSYFEYSCENGYNLHGMNRSTCLNNGWNSDAPSCIPLCDLKLIRPCQSPLICKGNQKWPRPPRPLFSFANMSDVATLDLTEDLTVDFSCEVGYELVGAKVITCSKDGWSHSIPTCKKSECDDSILDDCTYPLICWRYYFGMREYTRIYKGSVQKLSQNEKLFISCENDYLLSGNNYLTCKGGKWNGTMPKCIEPSCRADLLPKCENPMICTAYYYNSGRVQEIINNYGESSKTFPTNTMVVFNCTDGHVLNGAKTATCNNHGWKYDGDIYNSECQRISNTCDKGILDNCTYPLICKRSYTEFGDFKKIQSATSQKSISDAEEIKFRCAYGYVLDGRNALTCMGGKWNGTMPKCIAPSCRADLLPKCEHPMICTAYYYNSGRLQDIINNYEESSKTFPTNTMVVFNCTDGHVLNGAKTATCSNHGWKYDGDIYDPECQRISNTCDKGILDNCTYPLICESFGTEFWFLFENATSQESISDAEEIKFSCDSGYVLDGRNTLTCKGGKWDGTMPKCIVHSCSADLLPECKYPLTCTRYDSEFKSEQIITDNSFNESTNYALNTKVVYGCAEGLKLKGEEQTTCSSNGWSHVQSLKLPQCISPCDLDIFKSCKPPLICYYFGPEMTNWLTVDNSSLINYVAINSIVGFNCEDGFKLQGSRSISCDPEGWNEPISKCVK